MLSAVAQGVWARITVEGGDSPLILADGINGGAFASASKTYMLYCTEGQRVWVQSTGASAAHTDNYCSFSGMLIFR